MNEVKKLDDFECDSYRREEVEVIDLDNVVVKAHANVWCDGIDDLEEWDWDFDEFEARWFT